MPGPSWMSVEAWKATVAAGEAADAALRKSFIPEAVKAIGERTLEFTISTGSVDRDNDTIRPEGWKLTAYRKNPVVLWAHSYFDLPIARAKKIRVEDGRLVAAAEFAPAEIHPFAETVFQLIKGGFLNATSVGFQPRKYARNEERGGMDFEEQELLEFSLVPVPANPECLIEARAAGLDVEAVTKWARAWLEAPGAETAAPDPEDCPMGAGVPKTVPRDVSRELAAEGTAWAAPTLGDFTGEEWGDLTDAQRRRIAGHYAWAREVPPETFGSCKLPHHRASDGRVVWRGVATAMAVLMGGRGGVDLPAGERQAVYEHLASHYRQFDKEPPDFEAADPLTAELAALTERVRCLEDGRGRDDDDPPEGEAMLALEVDDEERMEIDPEAVQAALTSALGEAVGAEVRRAVNRLRGLVD